MKEWILHNVCGVIIMMGAHATSKKTSSYYNRKEGIFLSSNPIPPRRGRTQKKKTRIWPWVIVFLCFLGAAVAGAMFASSSLLDRPAAEAVEEGLLTAKDKPKDREDDPFIAEKMCGELEGILLWACEGLLRLIGRNYQFTAQRHHP